MKKKPAKTKRGGAAPAKGTRKSTSVARAATVPRRATKKAGRKASKVKGKAKPAAARSQKGVPKALKRSPAASPDRAGHAQPQSETRRHMDRVVVQNVNVPGYRTTVDARKYDAMKSTLLAALPKSEPGLTQAEMFSGVRGKLPEDVFPGQDKAEWWVKCVQLDLEAKGEMRRSASKPLRWSRAS